MPTRMSNVEEGDTVADPREYFTDLHDAQQEEVKWIVEHVVPIGLQIIGGAPKSFKSTVTDALPAIIAQWPCFALPKWAKLAPGMEGPSIILSGEATASELAWLYRTGFGCATTPDTIYINDDPWDFKLDRKDTVGALLSMLDHVRPRYCLIDPLRKYHSGDENDAAYVEGILYPLRKWAVQNDSCIGVVHHARKDNVNQDDESKMDPSQLRGSNAIFGAADSILMCRCIDRTIGRIRIAATHKRAPSWCRDVLLGVPGHIGWSKLGVEYVSATDINVERLLLQGSSVEQIAKQLRLKPEEVNESLDKRERNK